MRIRRMLWVALVTAAFTLLLWQALDISIATARVAQGPPPVAPAQEGSPAWWIEPADSAGDVGRFASLALAPGGHPQVVHCMQDPSYDTCTELRYASWNGAEWLTATIDDAGYAGEYASLALDSAAQPHVAYCRYEPLTLFNCAELRYAHLDGSDWTVDVVDEMGAPGAFASLALDGAGRPHITYRSATADELRYAYLDGATWLTATVDDGFGAGYWSSLAIDNAGRPNVAYLAADVLTFARWDGADWVIEAVDPLPSGGAHVSLALREDDRPRVAYGAPVGEHGFELRFAWRDDTSWHTSTLDASGSAGYWASLALGPEGVPHVAYQDRVFGEAALRYAVWEGGWLTQVVDQSGYAGSFSSLALDEEGRPVIAYRAAADASGPGELRLAAQGRPLPGCRELLVNGGFETGDLPPWDRAGQAGIGPGYRSAWGGWLGGFDNGEDELFQPVAIPPGDLPAHLAFWWLAEAGSPQPDDHLAVVIQHHTGNDTLLTLPADPLPGIWQQEMLDLGAYTGTEVVATFHAHTDLDIPTTFRVDDASLLVCGLSDLVLEQVLVEPEVAYPGEPALLTAAVFNTGPDPFTNVPVRFSANDAPLVTATIALIPPGQMAEVTATARISPTGLTLVSARANPEEVLFESRLDNNYGETQVEVVWERNPPHTRPELALLDLSFDPHRPAAGQAVQVNALLENMGRSELVSATVALWVDDEEVARQVVTGVPPHAQQPLELFWPSAVPGRHAVTLLVDPDGLLYERNEENNRLDDWIRVAGEADPLPDLEVAQISLVGGTPNPGEARLLTVEVCNEGYAGAEHVPVLITLDGRELARVDIPSLPQGACETIEAVWEHLREGSHVIGAWIDPADALADNSVLNRVVEGVNIPGAQYNLWANASPTRWTPIGPDSIDGGDFVGRIDAIDISRQDWKRMVIGAPAGGVWVTTDGGGHWYPVADYLDTPRFAAVAFDPLDDTTIYAGTGSSLYKGGLGLYKSADSGGHWKTFANTGVGEGYGALVLTYTQPNSLTLFAGTDTGVWMWRGSPSAMTTTLAGWTPVWTQTVAGRSNSIIDLILTPESAPRLYASVYGDGVHWAWLSNPATWTRLSNGWPATVTHISLGNSAADPDRIFAAAKRTNGDLDVYRIDGASGSWVHTNVTDSVASRQRYGSGNSYNAFIAVHPTNANALYVGGVRGFRSLDGGQTFPYQIPDNWVVHDDYKAAAFDPSAPSFIYFVTDGGVYRCGNNTGTMNCTGLNDELAVTMFYDIALAPTDADRTVGGTQDNGNIMGDGTVDWVYIDYGGDGRYVAIDPADEDTIYAHNENQAVWKTLNAGVKWSDAHHGLPLGSADNFMTIDPTDGQTLLLARGGAWETTNGGGRWDPIGPLHDAANGNITRVAIDGTNDRYYAGSVRGRIWTVAASQAITANWTRIFTHPLSQETRSMLLDPGDANVLYLTFYGDVISRVVRLTHSGGWPGTWADDDLTGNLAASGRKLVGPVTGHLQWDVVRGIAKHPSAELLYVGTDRGVFQGRPVNGSWEWYADTCGLPQTYVSDLEVHSSGDFIRAATYGRSAYQRSLTTTIAGPDVYDIGGGNDLITLAKTITGPWGTHPLLPGLIIENANLDRINDVDFYAIHLPPLQASECFTPGDPEYTSNNCFQCLFGLTVHAPETPDPFELTLYQANGSVFREALYDSNLSYALETPRAFFPSGVITIGVRSPTGCQSEYDLYFNYSTGYCTKDLPKLLTDPPRFRWVIPALDRMFWMFPRDPLLVNQMFLGQGPELGQQRVIFEWTREGDFQATFNVESATGLGATLLDAGNNPLTGFGPLQPAATGAPRSTSGVTVTQVLSVADLPAGWYAIDIGEGAFPTYFEIDFKPPPVGVFLPLVLRRA